MKEKSIIKNTAIYSIKTLSRLLLPLLIYPYISRILLPEGLGKYSFAESVLTYFTLLAGLGINNYAIRECSKIRDNPILFAKTADEIFSINVFSTIISYLLLLTTIVLVPKCRVNTAILLILSIRLPLAALGTEWVFGVYEEYTYITIRSVTFQIVSLILVFALIKNASDVNKYAAVVVISDAGSNVFNYVYARKYFHHRIVLKRGLTKHIRPILILFASMIAIQIYLNSDITMLGLMKTDYDVGIYAAGTKIYTLMQTVLNAMVSVAVPRMVFYYSHKEDDNEQYQEFLKKIINGFLAFLIPASIGVFLVAEQAIGVIFGVEFQESAGVLKILSATLLFSIPNGFFASAVLLMCEKEKVILKATIAGALFNIVGNIFLIPLLGYYGCALTTLVSEIIVFIIQISCGKNEIHGCIARLDLIKAVFACFPMLAISFMLKFFHLPQIVNLTLTVLCGCTSYGVCLVLLRHQSAVVLIEEIKSRINHRYNKGIQP